MKRVFYMFAVIFLFAGMAFVADNCGKGTIEDTEYAGGAAVTAAPNVQLADNESMLDSEEVPLPSGTMFPEGSLGESLFPVEGSSQEVTPEALSGLEPVMLSEYEKLYAENPDIIGWLSIADTNIDYPVMQTPEEEEYYIYRDFYGKEDKNGSLFMDTDSVVGVGTKEQQYCGGEVPSTNLMIYGHTMNSGKMFGNLSRYADEAYGTTHNIICFDSLYEKREYELIAVFYSQIYYKSQKVFKYYKFFQADTQEEFDDWYKNIKQLSIYDTGVTAEFGDEFITLSCCAYHVEDGRFVVVGKRVK